MRSVPWSYRLYRLAWSGLDLLFPPACGGCGKGGSRWCPDCQRRIPLISGPFCKKCGIPTKGLEACEKCRIKPPVFRMMRSWAVFDSPIQNALQTLKYRRNIGLGDSLALDMIVPAPLGRKRLQERGYNQVDLVARPLAYELGLEYAPYAMWKTRETRSQVGLSISQCGENVRGVYQADPSKVMRKSILLTGDVSTTGSTTFTPGRGSSLRWGKGCLRDHHRTCTFTS